MKNPMDEKRGMWYNIKSIKQGGAALEFLKITSTGFASNCWLLYDVPSGEAAVIDPSATERGIIRVLEEKHLTLTGIFLTHGHFDHIFSADKLRDCTGAKLYVHRHDAEMLTDSCLNESDLFLGYGDTYRPADGFIKGGDTFRIGENTVVVRHTPGHTPGSVTFVADRILFTGDTLFENSIGRTDMRGGDAQALQDSLRRLCMMPGDYTICSGHGAITTLDAERKNNPFLQDLMHNLRNSKETIE